MKKNILLLTTLVLGTIYGYSQNCDCTELLKYGIYNKFNSTDNIQNYSKLQQAINNSYEKSSGNGGSASVGFKGISGSYSKSESDMLKKITSNSLLDENDVKILKEQNSSYVSSEMMKSYRECLRLCEDKGLESVSDFPTDGRFSSISFTLKYKRPENVFRDPIIKEILISPFNDCYTCKGDLYEMAKNKDTISENTLYKMTCVRKISNEPFQLSGTKKFVYATEAHLSVQTDMGDYNLRIPPLFAKNPEFSRGVGEIVASMLTKEKFIETYGDDWVLADGTEAPLSEYRTYIEKYQTHLNGNLPNLCGVFLRGFNNGQKQNPQDSKIGEYQKFSIEKHNHKSQVSENRTGHPNGSEDSRGGTAHYKSYWRGNKGLNNNTHPTSSYGKDETRPENVTVNYFIKIN